MLLAASVEDTTGHGTMERAGAEECRSIESLGTAVAA
jgi:hypothetical protein